MKYRLLSDRILVIFLIYATVFFSSSFFNTGSNTKKITDYMVGEPQSQRKKKKFRSDISSM